MVVINVLMAAESLPSRERGLKSLAKEELKKRQEVAPLAGARIEIQKLP